MATYIGKTKQRSSKTKLWGFWLVVWGFFRGGGGLFFRFIFAIAGSISKSVRICSYHQSLIIYYTVLLYLTFFVLTLMIFFHAHLNMRNSEERELHLFVVLVVKCIGYHMGYKNVFHGLCFFLKLSLYL